MSVFDYDVDDGAREDAIDDQARRDRCNGKAKPGHCFVPCRINDELCQDVQIPSEEADAIRSKRDLPLCADCWERCPF